MKIITFNRYQSQFLLCATLAFIGNLTSSATPATSFDAWRSAHFNEAQLGDPAISGPDAAPAGDGATNLFKYSADLAPWASATERLPRMEGEAGELRFSYSRRKDADDLEYRVELSHDLMTWEPAGDQIEPF